MKNITIGKKEADGFAPILKDGKPTNARLAIWDEADVKRLQAIATEIQSTVTINKP